MKIGFNLFKCFFISAIILCCVAAPGHLKAELPDQISLEEAIQKISERFDVYFTYNKTLVQGYAVDFDELEEHSLTETMEKVLVGTTLRYRIHENKFVIIYKSDREGITSLKKMARHLDDLIVLEEERTVHSRRTVNLLGSRPIQYTQNLQPKRLTINVKGKVTDQAGEPLIGVNIQVKGTTKGATTDLDGNFVLDGINENDVLIFSYIGYEAKEVAVKGNTNLDVVLVSDSQLLEEVVVVGYGTQGRGNITGAVTSISSEKLEDRTITSFSEALAGQVSGVQIQQTSSEPGGGVSIKIRGTGSITAGTSPLYVIDGVPLDNSSSSAQAQGTDLQSPINPLASLNPSDIASIDILKDAAATAIYGSRGSNGVVIINTKKGISGKSNIQFNVSTGWQDVSAYKIPYKGLAEYVQTEVDAINNSYIRAGGNASTPNADRPFGNRIPLEYTDISNLETTDWQDLLFRVAPVQNYQLSSSSGSENIQYYISGNYFDQKGIIVGSGYKKYSFRSNIDAKVNDKIHLGLRIAPSIAKYNISRTQGQSYSGGLINALLGTSPLYGAYNEDGSFDTDFIFHYDDGQVRRSTYFNPLASAIDIDRDLSQFSTVGSLFATVDITKNIVFKSSVNIDYSAYNKDAFYPSTIYLNGAAPPRVPSAESFASRNISWSNENTLTYSNTFNSDHHLNVLVGFSEQSSVYHSSYITASGFPNDKVHTLNAGVIDGGNSISSEWSLLSAFGRINYNYKDKYLATVTTRGDGSSRFGANNRWGIFPSGSVGWRITGEDFMKDVTSISELKLRASYGYTGNFEIPNYGSLGLVGGRNYILGDGGGMVTNGLALTNISNQALGWEKSNEVNLGIELGLYNNRIYFTADLYNKLTSGLLLDVPVPLSTGFSSALRNIGKVRNKGIELALRTYNIEKKDLQWSTNFNISFNRNNVEALGPDNAPIIIGPRDVHNTLAFKTTVGEPVGSFLGWIYDGVFKNQAEVESYPHLNGTTPGDAKFRDVNNDGEITLDDKTIIGNNHPDFIYGFSSQFTFKNFGFNVVLQGLQGASVFNYMRRDATFRRQAKEFANYWRSPENPGDGMFKPGGLGSNREISTWMMEDASYLRIKNISLSYTLSNNDYFSKIFDMAKLYVSVENLLTITPYTGYNPDVNSVAGSTYRPAALQPGVDYGTYPSFRTISLGLNITL